MKYRFRVFLIAVLFLVCSISGYSADGLQCDWALRPSGYNAYGGPDSLVCQDAYGSWWLVHGTSNAKYPILDWGWGSWNTETSCYDESWAVTETPRERRTHHGRLCWRG